MKYRLDQDSLGKVKIPADAYYGAFTGRAIKQYHVTGNKSHENLIKSFVMIKRSAAIANMKTKAIDAKRGKAIVTACDKILSGKYIDQFVVDMINSGAGTAFNMNSNEVISNVALEVLHKKKGQYEFLHPNDHVNMSQSSNDTYPTAMHVAILMNLKETILAIDILIKSLSKKAKQFSSFKKIGRTHLMDALPVTLGSEFTAYVTSITKARNEIISAQKELQNVALGGTAVGSGANTPKGYRKIAIAELGKISKLSLKPEKDMQHSLQSKFAVANLSSALRNLALEIGKIANDIRLMASGPIAGLAELGIPAGRLSGINPSGEHTPVSVHAGSSMGCMPGKINPSLAECMNMVCFNIISESAKLAGAFELNVMLPAATKICCQKFIQTENLSANKDKLLLINFTFETTKIL